jgi:hypothetical protein
VTAALKPRHRHQEFLAFLQQIERTYRNVLDPETGQPGPSSCTWSWTTTPPTNTRTCRQWREANPRFKIHFTPTRATG